MSQTLSQTSPVVVESVDIEDDMDLPTMDEIMADVTPAKADVIEVIPETKLKRKLRNIPALKTIPRLSGGTAESIIDLDSDSKETTGVERLQGRFVRHTSKTAPAEVQEVKLHLVSKESNEDGKIDLKANEITVNVRSIHAEDLMCPKTGVSYNSLREKLLGDISKKKLKGMEERITEFEMENEEGFDQEEEEEEFEIEDASSEDDDGDQEKNEFLDTCAVEDNDVQKSDSEEEDETENKTTPEKTDETTPDKIDSNVSQELFCSHEKKMTHSENKLDSSLEYVGSITSHQPCGGQKQLEGASESENEFNCTPRKNDVSWLSQSRCFPKSYSSENQEEFSENCQESMKLRLDTESQQLEIYLDHSEKKAAALAFPDEAEITESQNIRELLGLCTGKFRDTAENQFDKNNPTSDEEDEQIVKPIIKKKVPRLRFDSESENDESEMDAPTEDQEEAEAQDETTEVQDEDEYDELEEEQEFDDDENILEPGKKPVISDFFDVEAELSGSDFGSEDEEGDDVDENPMDDHLSSDEDISQEELRNQVGRAHMKALLDEDKKELRFFQNMYLEDGDLHSEGGGRARKFRWKNSDDIEMDGEKNGSGDEAPATEQEEHQDENWRVERFEREKWLQEQKIEEHISPEKNNAKTRLMRSFKMINRASFGGSQSQDSTTSQKKILNDLQVLETGATTFVGSEPRAKSFLTRNPTYLRSLSEKMNRQEPAGGGIGRRSTKNFLFLSASPAMEQRADKRPADEIVKNVQQEKKIKINVITKKTTTKITRQKKSVFDFLE